MDAKTSTHHQLARLGLAAAAASGVLGIGVAAPAIADDTAPTVDCSAGAGLVLFSYWKFVAEHPECAPDMDDAYYEGLLYGTGGDGPGNKWACERQRYGSRDVCLR